MKRQIASFTLAALFAASPALAEETRSGLMPPADGAVEMPYGQAEFLNSCAACHGESGRGDGQIAGDLLKPPADLTILSRENDGAFPYYRVFAVIDGRYVVSGHGDREMPIWGRQFLEEDARTFGPNGGELITTERIHELTSYIESIQR